ncbi:multidrug effflux MFS transporter [Pseudoduganella violacea]|uniref:Bcr/CflA family efflux transporter n=1 Tax=Pseudoduganella violacea TaxID=1715466 RepID=A0A7W5BBH2_9BURK|nr:multidrug effflux MFS transporter [Pseudoduganella violacea]MBB3119816.1 DHA1 family bicyclomycin/chloramphenicol resistance-like MFS transporter [Pseudoduganella violacea]
MFPNPNPPPTLPPDPVQPVPPSEPRQRAPLAPAALAAVLAGLSMLGPFSIDAYLPAFPAIQSSLKATPLQVQQSLSAYMAAFALMVLWHGALSDAFGRRNVILVGLVAFALGTIGCAAAHSVEYLWFFRIVQGLSAGAGVVVGRAIIRDLYADAAAARLLSLVTMIFSIAPAVAPILGGLIVTAFDWRTIFLALLIYTVLLFIVCYRRLPETLPPAQRQPFNPRFLLHSYASVLGSPPFLLKSGVVAFNFAGLFICITSAPEALPSQLGLGPHQFGWLFIPAVSGIFLGALAANRIVGRISFARQIGLGFACLIAAASVNVAYHLWLPPALPWSMLPLFVYTFGMSVVAPAATLLALDLFPHIRGTAASCQSFASTLLGAVVAGVVAPLVSHSLLLIAIGQLLFAVTSLALWLTARLYRRMLSAHPVQHS